MQDLSREDQKDLLRQHFLLEALPDKDLEELTRYARVQEAKAGETLFIKGDPGDSMMVVVSGRVLIFVTSADGREIIFNIMNEGEVFGEIALLDGLERTADARASRHSVSRVGTSALPTLSGAQRRSLHRVNGTAV